jgi:hypothetical protein
VDGGQGTRQPGGGTQFFERQVGLLVQQLSQVAMMLGEDHRLASRTVVLGTNLADPPSLLQELFDHAQRHAIAGGNRFPRAFFTVIRSQNPFPQIQRECFHTSTVPYPIQYGYSFI